MSFFSCFIHKSFINIIIYWVLEIFVRLMKQYQWDNFVVIKDNLADNEYLYIIYINISHLLTGFLILYIKFSMKKESEGSDKNQIKLIYKNPLGKKNKYFYLRLIFISSLEVLNVAVYFIFFSLVDTTNEQLDHKSQRDIITLIDILTRYILSILMLQTKIYKHHKWSIVAIITGFILIVPFDLLRLYLDQKINTFHSTFYIIMFLYKAILFPLEDTLTKKFFSDYYILPEYFLFYLAIIQSIITLIFTIIFYLTNIIHFNLSYNTGNIIMSIIYILSSFIKKYITVKLIYYFSSQSVSFLIISQSMASSLQDIITFFETSDKSIIASYNYLIFVFGIIAVIIIIIGTMVYDEIIVINKWGLNLNVKRGIHERSLSEIENIIEEFDKDETLDADITDDMIELNDNKK